MGASNYDLTQEARPEDDFDVAAELGRCFGEVLDLGTTQIATETVAQNGGVMRAFIKLGPFTGPQIRDLRQRMRELAAAAPAS